jgi:hypothetical protein
VAHRREILRKGGNGDSGSLYRGECHRAGIFPGRIHFFKNLAGVFESNSLYIRRTRGPNLEKKLVVSCTGKADPGAASAIKGIFEDSRWFGDTGYFQGSKIRPNSGCSQYLHSGVYLDSPQLDELRVNGPPASSIYS